MMILTGEKLLLRPLRLSDAEHCHMIWGDERVTATLNMGTMPGLAATYARLEERICQEHPIWGITERVQDMVIGTVRLKLYEGRPVADFGYMLRHDQWGKGIMTEAVGLVLRYAFTECDFHRIGASHFGNNPASGQVMLKCGMKLEGIHREYVCKNGQWLDMHEYGILRREWEGTHAVG